MRRLLASAAAMTLLAGTAGTALAKDHILPAQSEGGFGQDRADESYVIGGDTAAPDAKGADGENGVTGSEISGAAQDVDREPAEGKKPRN